MEQVPTRGQAARARAKELRKEAERRSEKKEARRACEKAEVSTPGSAKARELSWPATAPVARSAPEDLAAAQVCKFFLAGTCNKGDKCRFRHVVPEAPVAAAGEEAEVHEALDMLNETMWQEVMLRLDGRSLLATASVCTELAAAADDEAVWTELHGQLFRTGGEPESDTYAMAHGYTARERVSQSEAQLDLWRRAADSAMRPPLSLALPGMTSVAMCGGLGVSTHAGRLARLWDGGSGRRLATSEHRRELTASAAAAGVVAVGDAGGHTHLYSTTADFSPLSRPHLGLPAAPDATAGGVQSLALLSVWEGAAHLLVSSDAHGLVGARLYAAHAAPDDDDAQARAGTGGGREGARG